MTFFNLNRTLGESRGYNKLVTILSRSQWFHDNASYVAKSKGHEKLEFDLISYVLSSPYSQGFGVIGEDVVAGVMDEIDSPVAPVKQKERVLQVYDATVRRFKDRFAPTGYSLGKVFLVASKQDELSFIDNFIETMKDKPGVLVYDAKLWDVKPQHIFSGKTFPVAVGDAFRTSKVAESPEVPQLLKEGWRIIEVPEEFKFDFQRDIIGALRDLAGITVAGLRKRKLIAAEKFILDCFDITKENPLLKERIDIGLDDEINLIEYIDLSKIRTPRSVPRFLHLDISISGDSTSLSMAGIKEWTQGHVEKEDGTFNIVPLPVIETDFVLELKARDGDRIPLHKTRKLVLDLRARGFHIALFTADLLLLSEDTFQILQKAGIKTESLSLDKSNQPYLDFRNLVYEKRWVCYNHKKLFAELINLEQDPTTHKIDHPVSFRDGEEVVKGSKDLTDAVAGAVFSCLTNTAAPVDLAAMRQVFDKLHDKKLPLQLEEAKLPMTDSAGTEIIGVKHGNQLNKVLDVMNRLRS